MRRIVSLLSWLPRVVLTALGVKRRYSIGDVSVSLDYTHRLPDYQKKHAHYDRFLPHLAGHLPPGSLVIDVGANVGDTLAGMVDANAGLEYVCVEADRNFYEDLLGNVTKIQAQLPGVTVHTVNTFIGRDLDNVSLEGEGGTKHAVSGAGSMQAELLGEVIRRLQVTSEVALLKSDVDGFDYDVIRASFDLLADKPLLFFECQYADNEQFQGYLSLFNELMERGYGGFAFFDNFGQYVTQSSSVAQLEDLLRYIQRQNDGKGTRTFNYYDILAFDSTKQEFVASVIGDYVRD